MDAGAAVFTGGANVPTATGWRFNVSLPFARLAIGTSSVALLLTRVPRTFGEPLELDAGPSEVASIYPVKGGLAGRGVGIRLQGGQEFYFWTLNGDRIRQLLRERGFPVTDEPQRPHKVWRRRKPNP